MKVYVVTSGTYSDYSIQAVFSSRKVAKKFVDKFNKKETYGDAAEIETYTLNKPEDKWYGITVRMAKDGTVKETWSEFNADIGFQTFDVENNLVWTVATQDEKRAVKVVNEKRIQLIANNKWEVKEIK